MATKALTYLRVSGTSQVDGDGFPRQREACAKFAANNGYELVGEFIDEAVSGTNELEDREGLSALLERIAGNGVRCVLVENATRLARDLLVSEMILAKFRQLGVVVLGADGTDLTVSDNDPTRKLFRQFMGALAEFDKSMIVAKLGAARKRKREATGRCEGVLPYGSLAGEAQTVELIRKLRRKPKLGKRPSYADVADKLNSQGIKSRSGKPWNRGTVFAIAKRM